MWSLIMRKWMNDDDILNVKCISNVQLLSTHSFLPNLIVDAILKPSIILVGISTDLKK